jgi:hypothetical protein
MLFLFGIGFAGLGAVVVFMGISAFFRKRKELKAMLSAEGVIVSWSRKEDVDMDNRPTVYHTPTISFNDAAGSPVQFVSKVAVTRPVPPPGGKVLVRYDPQDPNLAVIDKAGYKFAGSIMLLLIGMMLAAAGLIVLVIYAAG